MRQIDVVSDACDQFLRKVTDRGEWYEDLMNFGKWLQSILNANNLEIKDSKPRMTMELRLK